MVFVVVVDLFRYMEILLAVAYTRRTEQDARIDKDKRWTLVLLLPYHQNALPPLLPISTHQADIVY